MSSEAIRIGVIGAGKMGRLHLKCLKDFSDTEVVGVYDLNPRLLKAVGEEVGVPIFADLESLLFESDAVVIATSTCSHFSVTEKALESGIHVLVEKPVGGSSERAVRLFALATKNGLTLKAGFLERVRLTSLPKDLVPCSIDRIYSHRLSITEGRDRSVDIIADLLIHDLDLIAFLFQRDPIGTRGTGIGENGLKAVHSQLIFGSDVLVNVAASYQAPAISRMMMIDGEGQKLVLDFQNGFYHDIVSGRRGELLRDPLSVQHREFIQAIRSKKIIDSSNEIRSLIWADKIRSTLVRSETNPSLALGLPTLNEIKAGVSDVVLRG